MASASAPLELFYSYAHKDEPLRQELEKQLSPLQHDGLITGWRDRDINAGQEWERAIDQHLESAGIILLLISSDFMASEYCYSKEMTRALERHQAGEATVIPILLRPVDWTHAPFSHLQALPRDNRPVTTWANQDEAFAAIAQGIRKLVADRRHDASAQLGTASVPPTAPRRFPWWTLPIIALIFVGYFVYGQWAARQQEYQQHITAADTYLATGRYADAAQSYRQALRVLPDNAAARLGMEKAEVFDSGEPEVIGQKLKQLEQQAPDDPDVQILLGRFYAAQDEDEKARQHYERAIALNPQAADAYFGLGIIHTRAKQIDRAIAMYEKALAVSEATPKYIINLAALHVEQDNYPAALRQYGRLKQDSPIATFETAAVYRLMGNLEQARGWQEKTVSLLDDPHLMNRPDNQEPWEYTTHRAVIHLTEPADKKCYVYYSLAATLFLDGRSAEATTYVNQAQALQSPHEADIRELVNFDLQRLAEKSSAWREAIAAFQRQWRLK